MGQRLFESKRQSQILSLLVSFALFLAIRYLRTPRRHRLAQFTAFCAIIGIAFGVAAMILAQAAADGFRQAMQDKILANTAHITVFSKNSGEIAQWQELERQIKQIENVKSISPSAFDNALITGKTSFGYALIKGQKSKIKNQSSEISVSIGKDLAQKVGLSAGDTAEIVSGSGSSTENFAAAATTVIVAEIFETGLYEYDSTWIRVSLEDAAKLTGRGSVTVTALEIETNNIYESNKVAAQIEKLINGNGSASNYKVLDWQTANRPLFAALSLERRVALLVVALIVFIAVLNITTTLALVVNERKLDIAVLKTCGAKTSIIIFIFLLEGLLLGIIGIAAGVVLGLSACFLCNYFGLISLPPDVYSISEIVLVTSVENILLTGAAAFVLILAASVFPAWTAAKIRPLENLRN